MTIRTEWSTTHDQAIVHVDEIFRVRVGLSVVRADGPPEITIGLGTHYAMLTKAEWEELRDQVDGAWQELVVLCTCGHLWLQHAMDSPHGCCAGAPTRMRLEARGGAGLGCSCRCFQAAGPDAPDNDGEETKP